MEDENKSLPIQEQKNVPEAIRGDVGLDDVKSDVTPDNENLIFGKFKTMEEAFKGYKDAEERALHMVDIEKDLQKYRTQAENYERDAIARKCGFNDRLEMALNFDVKQKELDNYLIAGSHLLKPKERLELNKLINKCRQNHSREDLFEVRRFFSPEVVALASEDAALYKNIRHNEYENMREQEKNARYNRKLEEFRKLNGEWLKSEFNNDLIMQAVELSDGKVDLSELKTLVEKIESAAVEKYKKDISVKQENEAVQDNLLLAEGTSSRNRGKKWLTREEFYKLSPAEEAERYDSIVEQVLLENRGLLPRMLTRK